MNEEKISGTLTVTGTINGTITIGGGGSDTLKSALSTDGLDEYVYDGSGSYDGLHIGKLTLSNVTSIEGSAFRYSTGIDEIDAPEVTTAGGYIIANSNVKKISLPKVTTMGAFGLSNAQNLEELELNSSFVPTNSANFAYLGVADKEKNKIDIDITVTDLPGSTFNAACVRNLTIRGLTSTRNTSTLKCNVIFGDFSLPDTVYINNDSGEFGSIKFYGDINLPKFTGHGYNGTGSNLFNGAKFAKKRITLAGLQYAESGSFRLCGPIDGYTDGFKELVLPSLLYIGSNAFNSASITDLYLPGETKVSLYAMVSNVFNSCPIYTDANARVHVNPNLVETYKTDSFWSAIESKIVAITEADGIS